LYESSPLRSSTSAPGTQGATRSRSSIVSQTSSRGAFTSKSFWNSIHVSLVSSRSFCREDGFVVLPGVHIERHAARHPHLADELGTALEQLPDGLVPMKRGQFGEDRARECE